MVLSVILATVPGFAQNFYDARFQSGVADFNRGEYAHSVEEMRIAAFGRVDDLPRYEIAEIYLTVANEKLDHIEEARTSATKVLRAEMISAAYSSLDLPQNIRAAFESLLPVLLSREQLSNVPAFAHLASQALPAAKMGPATTRRPLPIVPTPTKEPNVAVTVGKNDDKAEQPQNLDYGQLALDRVAAGDEPGARRYADLAFARDESNPKAHTALAQLGRSHSAWKEVAEHYAVVRTRRRLTDDETAAYFIALVNIGRTEDAAGVRRSLPASVLNRSDVRDAIQTLEPKPVSQPVAPAPVPAPVPRTTPAPAPVAPAPVQVPTPTPKPVAPAPAPVQAPAASPAPLPVPIAAPPTPDSAMPVSDQIAEAEQMVAAGNIVGARSDLRRIAAIPNLQRSERQSLARVLSQTALYAESSAQYRKTYPLKAGEESHMFYEAVNRYELGDYSLARQLITRALPALPQTPAILAYRDRIMAQQ